MVQDTSVTNEIHSDRLYSTHVLAAKKKEVNLAQHCRKVLQEYNKMEARVDKLRFYLLVHPPKIFYYNSGNPEGAV